METTTQTKYRLETIIKENFPDVDLSPGSALADLVTKLAAYLQNELHNEITAVDQGKSIQQVLASSVATYTDTVDKIASNYNVTRNQGSRSSGLIKVYVSDKKTYYLSAGLGFTQPNLGFTFATTLDYMVTSSLDTVSDAKLGLYEEDGRYFFIVPVLSTTTGNTNNTQVTDKTKFGLTASGSLIGFVSAEAFGNFSAGRNTESDQELITRFKEGMSTKAASSPKSILANLRTAFPTVQTISIVGINDPELTRDKKNIFGFATPGMADIYTRTSDSLETKFVQGISASNIGGTTWSMAIDQSVAPGFYRIMSVTPSSLSSVNVDGTVYSVAGVTGTLVISNIDYGFNSSTTQANYLSDATDARLTKYQTAMVTFTYDDPKKATTGLFDVMFLYMPLIQDIQDYLLSDDNRVVSSDYLVKAVIPCDVSLGIRVYRKNSLDTLPLTDIKRDIYNYICSIPFGEDLVFSRIMDICHNYEIKRVDMPVFLKGTIMVPSASPTKSITVTGDDTLVIPDMPELGITKNTVNFYINYIQTDGQTDNIGISVV